MLSLAATLELQIETPAKSPEFYGIYAMTILYIANALGAFDYQSLIKESNKVGAPSAKDFRLTLHENLYYGLQIKLFALRLAKLKAPTTSSINALVKEFSLAPRDAKLITWLFDDCAWFRKDLVAQANTVSDDCELLTLSGIDAAYSRIYPEVLVAIKRYTRKKLRFLVKSNNLDFEHYYSELLEKSVKAIRKLAPIDYTDLHLLNAMKQTIKNHGTNIIKHGTTLKRGRIVNVGNDSHGQAQFQMHCTSFNQMKAVVDSEGNELTPDAVDESSTIDKFEVKFSISELLTRYKRGGKKHKFLTILLGEDCPEFTLWLQQQGLATVNDDHVDVQNRLPVEEFNQRLSAFLEVEYRHVLNFIATLKTELPIAVS